MSILNLQQLLDKIFDAPEMASINKAEFLAKFSPTSYPVNASLDLAETVQPSNIITNIPSGGYKITKSGNYTLGSNLAWEKTQECLAAITICASEVTLDLAGFAITSNMTDNTQINAGICVKGTESKRLNDVTIKNGILNNMGCYGIEAEYVNSLKIESITIDGVSINADSVQNLTPSGIQIRHADGPQVLNCVVKNLNVTTAASAGIQLMHTAGGTVSECRCSEFVNHDGSVQGFSYIYTIGVNTIMCTARKFKSFYKGNSKTLGHTVIGFVPMFCAGLSYENCSSDSLTGCCDDCHGMSVFIALDVTVSGFTASNITDGVDPKNTGAKATGLEVYGWDVKIDSCNAANIKAIHPQDLQAAGFSAAGRNITFSNCKADKVSVSESTGTHCRGIGFGWAPDPRVYFDWWEADETTYTNCQAMNCDVGFDTWKHKNSVWDCASTSECSTGILKEPNTAVRVLSIDKCSEQMPNEKPTTSVTNDTANNRFVDC